MRRAALAVAVAMAVGAGAVRRLAAAMALAGAVAGLPVARPRRVLGAVAVMAAGAGVGGRCVDRLATRIAAGLGARLGGGIVRPALVQAAVGVTLLVEVDAVVLTGLVDRVANRFRRQHARHGGA